MIGRAITVAALTVALLGGGTACTSDPPGTPAAQNQAGQGDPSVLLAQGIQQGTGGDLNAAEATFRRVTTIDRSNKYAWFNLGVIAQQRGDGAQAIKDYDSALAIDARFTSALYNKAIVVEATNADDAMQLYRTIISIDPMASTAFLRLGMLHDKKDDRSGALGNFRSAIAIDPSLAGTVPSSYRDELQGR